MNDPRKCSCIEDDVPCQHPGECPYNLIRLRNPRDAARFHVPRCIQQPGEVLGVITRVDPQRGVVEYAGTLTRQKEPAR